MNDNEAGVDIVANNAQQFLNAMDQVSKAFDGLTRDINEAATKINNASKDIDKAGDEMGGVAKDIDDVGKAADKAGDEAAKGLKKVPDAAENAATKTSHSGDIIKGVFVGIGMAALNMAAEAGQAFVEFATDSVKLAGDFEAGMNKFKVAAGGDIDAKGVEEFRDLFLDIGKRLPVSTMEVQQAAETLVKGGIDPLILKTGGLEDAIQFAAAAEMDLNAAAELSIKTLGVFGDSTATAEEQTAFLAKTQDLLVKAAGASTLNVDNLGAATLTAAGQAKAAGVDYQDFVTTMGLISPAFNSAAEAGTSYKNFLARLIPTTDNAKGAMSDLGLMTFNTDAAISQLNAAGIDPEGMGVNDMKVALFELAMANGASEKEANKWLDAFDKSAFYDLKGNFIGNSEAAQLLADATKNLSAEERSKAFQTIFGNDAMGAAIALADQGTAGYDAFAKKMNEASGVQAAAAGKQQGFNVAMDNFNGSVEALQITIGSYLLPILTDLFNNVLSPAIGTVMSLVDAFFAADGATVNLAYAFGSLLGLGSETQETFDWMAESIGEAMSYIALVVEMVLAEINTFWKENGEEIMEDVSELWEGVMGVIGPAVEIISFVIKSVFKDIAVFMAKNGDDILGFIKNVWKLIFTVIDTALDLIGNVLSVVMFAIRGDWASVWNAIKKTVTDLLGNIITFIQTALNTILNLFGTNLDTLNKDVIRLMNSVKKSITDAIDGALTGIKSFFENFLSAGRDLVNKIGEGIGQVAGSIADKIKSAVSAALSFPQNLVSDLLSFGNRIITEIVAGITALAGNIAEAVGNAVSGAINDAIAAIRAFINNPLGGIQLPDFNGDGKPGNVKGQRTPYTYNPFEGGAGNVSTTYQLSVATRQSDASVIHQFNVMRAMSNN